MDGGGRDGRLTTCRRNLIETVQHVANCVEPRNIGCQAGVGDQFAIFRDACTERLGKAASWL